MPANHSKIVSDLYDVLVTEVGALANPFKTAIECDSYVISKAYENYMLVEKLCLLKSDGSIIDARLNAQETDFINKNEAKIKRYKDWLAVGNTPIPYPFSIALPAEYCMDAYNFFFNGIIQNIKIYADLMPGNSGKKYIDDSITLLDSSFPDYWVNFTGVVQYMFPENVEKQPIALTANDNTFKKDTFTVDSTKQHPIKGLKGKRGN